MDVSDRVTAAIIVIGNEILSGRTQDKNLNFLANNLGEIGIILVEARVIKDNEEAIIKTVNELKGKYHYIFTTGGIGPTHDDITSLAIAKAFNRKFIRDPRAVKELEAYYPEGMLNESRLKMADMPENSLLIKNPASGAPGFIIENVYVMAGVPHIMQAMFETIKPDLKRGAIVKSRSVTTYLLEGAISKGFEELQNKYPNLEMGSYPFKTGDRWGTDLIIRGTDDKLLDKAFKDLQEFIAKFD